MRKQSEEKRSSLSCFAIRKDENLSHGETEFHKQKRKAQADGEEICRPLCEIEGDGQ